MAETPPNRDPTGVLGALALACASHPTQRVAQVLVNALGEDPFYIENEKAETELLAYSAKPSSVRLGAERGEG